MGFEEELVSRVPGTVLDLDDNLKLQTHRPGKQRALPLTRAEGGYC